MNTPVCVPMSHTGFLSLCISVFGTRPTTKSANWPLLVTSQRWSMKGRRPTALRRAAAPTEQWIMRRMASPIPILSSTSCCSSRPFTSWWHSLTGIGEFPCFSAILRHLHYQNSHVIVKSTSFFALENNSKRSKKCPKKVRIKVLARLA